MGNIGFRILPNQRKVSRELLEQFRTVVTPHVSDNINRVFAGGAELRPFFNNGKLLGTAITVRTRPGDNLIVHKAIDMGEEGDVIVVDAGGDTTNAIVGEIMLRLAIKKGIAGFVINGAIRDSAAFMNGDFPVYAKGITHRGPYKDGPGEINAPISIAGMVISPGDIILGDEDGVVSISAEHAEEILKKIRIQEKKEKDIFKSIEDGTIDRSWVDQILRQRGCDF